MPRGLARRGSPPPRRVGPGRRRPQHALPKPCCPIDAPCALHNPAVPLPRVGLGEGKRGEGGGGGATHIVPLDEFDAFLQGVGDADGLELESVHPWLCPGHLHRIDALSPVAEKPREAAASAGTPGRRKQPQERGRQPRSARLERAGKRLPRQGGRQASLAPEEGPAAAGANHAAAHPLYTAGSPRTHTPARSLTHTHTQGHGASGAARSGSLPRPPLLPPPPGSAPEVPPRRGQRAAPAALRRHLPVAAGAASAAGPDLGLLSERGRSPAELPPPSRAPRLSSLPRADKASDETGREISVEVSLRFRGSG